MYMYMYSAHFLYTPATRCSDGEIRLAGGQLESEGRVEICFNAQFGTICDDGFGQLDAVVACRQLGYNNGVGGK